MNEPSLSGYIIALLELLEAEGRTLKEQIKKLLFSLVFISIAAILLIIGLFFLIWSAYSFLTLYYNATIASLLMGSGTIGLAMLLLVWQKWRH